MEGFAQLLGSFHFFMGWVPSLRNAVCSEPLTAYPQPVLPHREVERFLGDGLVKVLFAILLDLWLI